MSRILFGLAGVLICSTANAQTVSLGASVGMNSARYVAELVDNADISSERRIGLTAGARVTIDLSRVVGVQVEALYSEKGQGGVDGDWMRLSYLEVPVLVRFTLPVQEVVFRPFLIAGAAAARELSCTGQTRPATIAISAFTPTRPPLQPLDCAMMRDYRGDLSIVAGGGVEWMLRRVKAGIDLRYTYGATDLWRRSDLVASHNRVLSAAIGLAMPLAAW